MPPPYFFLGGMFWQDRLQQYIGSGEPPRLREMRRQKCRGDDPPRHFAPFILIIVCLCGMMDAATDHNRAAVEWCFGDGAIPAAVPEEYAGHITQMRACFAVLDGAVGKLNAELEEGSVPLRANRVKADFLR